MTILKYEIAPPTNVVDASFSPAPDDLSRVYIRIEASAPEDAPDDWSLKVGQLDEIRFEIAVANPDAKNLEEALTRNPRGITPVAEAFGRWTFSSPEEGGIFIARPDLAGAQDETLLEGDERLVFFLYDVEVVERAGTTEIKVTEVKDGKSTEAPALKIRKSKPGLRIDYFRASEYSVASGESVDLFWATTGASEIHLLDQNGRSLLGDNPTDPGIRDGSFGEIFPQSTSTYTLKASSGDGDQAVATQQLTITVTDRLTLTGWREIEHSLEISNDRKSVFVEHLPLAAEVGDMIRVGDEERTITRVEELPQPEDYPNWNLLVNEEFPEGHKSFDSFGFFSVTNPAFLVTSNGDISLGDRKLGGKLNIGGDTHVTGKLSVSSWYEPSIFAGDLKITDRLTVEEIRPEYGKSLSVVAEEVLVKGNNGPAILSVTGELAVWGNVSISEGELDVNGKVIGNNMEVKQNLSIGSWEISASGRVLIFAHKYDPEYVVAFTPEGIYHNGQKLIKNNDAIYINHQSNGYLNASTKGDGSTSSQHNAWAYWRTNPDSDSDLKIMHR